MFVRRVLRYQRGNQNPQIKEGKTMAKRKRSKGQTMVNKAQHIKLKILLKTCLFGINL